MCNIYKYKILYKLAILITLNIAKKGQMQKEKTFNIVSNIMKIY